MTTLTLALAILRMSNAPLIPGPREADARILAATILRAAAAHDVPPLILAAIAAHETGFNRRKVGAVGERGRWQVLPETARELGYNVTPEAMAADPINANAAAAWLARMRTVCAKRGKTAPAYWLSAYSGRGCRKSSGYARAVWRIVQAGWDYAAEPYPPALAAYWERIGVMPAVPEVARR